MDSLVSQKTPSLWTQSDATGLMFGTTNVTSYYAKSNLLHLDNSVTLLNTNLNFMGFYVTETQSSE